ncbi:HAD-like domain-containing protein [Haematococcus lacustris]
MSVAVASSGAPQKLARNLQLSGLLPLLDPYHVVSAAYVARGKPAPDVYLEAMRRVGCSDPTRALVVEDAVNGLKAGRAAGAFTVAVPTSLPAEVLRPWADLVVERLGLICLDNLTPAAAEKYGKPFAELTTNEQVHSAG